MIDRATKNIWQRGWPFGVIGVLFAGLVILGYFYYNVFNKLKNTVVELANTKTDLATLQEQFKMVSDELETEKYKNSLFGGQISQIMGTVGTLDKLSKIDKELLEKYSKVYFLNEHYVPSALTELPPDYIFEKGKQIQIHSQVYPYLQDMITSAKKDGIELKIISGYRSFGEQGGLKNNYLFSYGSGANKFSADQGYSEHQLGTTLDFTNADLGANFTNFEKTKSYSWLLDNAYRFGFILSYPKGNTYYQFEPWHWRFVGRRLASMLREEKKSFYDLAQDKINAYLINLFD